MDIEVANGENNNSAGRGSSPSIWISPSYFAVAPLIDTEEGDGDDDDREGKKRERETQDAWLPITESRDGNQFSAAFHLFCTGFGLQVLLLPAAFTCLGWFWGLVSVSLTFIWQLYTIWLLVQLHESAVSGIRYSRYLHLVCSAFGKRWGIVLAGPHVVYLSVGTCLAAIVIGGSALKALFMVPCGIACANKLTAAEWFLVFASAAAVVSQLPSLNSMAGVSLVGSAMAIGISTLVWVVSVEKGRMPGVSYDPVKKKGEIEEAFNVLNALGIVAFTFRGHNLIPEIQGTMPSSWKHPSRVPMWKGTVIAYAVYAVCLYPVVIGGYWAYGNKIPATGILAAFYGFHARDVSRFVLGLASFFVVTYSLAVFQIYAMPSFDYLESLYTRRKYGPCPWWLRASIRAFFVYLMFFAAVAIPSLSNVAGLAGGLALPVTLAYPCLMWIKVRQPETWSAMWWLNWGLGIFGLSLSALMIVAGVRTLVITDYQLLFFRPGNQGL